MRTFHGDPKLKAEALRRVRGHRKADRLAQGFYWERRGEGDWKGCAVGCLATPLGKNRKLDYPPEDELAREFGIPPLLTFHVDRIFERLPLRAAMNWPEQFLMALPVGVELSDDGVVGWGLNWYESEGPVPGIRRRLLRRLKALA